jgi:hypothetical protein
MPAFAQSAACGDLHFELANPTPGAEVDAGALVIQGIARDGRATSGTGIDHVDFFLGNRDEGGVSVGTTVPGSAPGPFGTFGSFQTTIVLPAEIRGGSDLVVYAHSNVTGQEVVITIPIAIGESASAAGQTADSGSTPTSTETCTNPHAAVAAGVAPAAGGTTTTVTLPGRSTVVLSVANPEPGSSVLAGAYVTQGFAFDRAATSGAGVDKVTIFLDSRDEGGLFLASATPGSAGMAPGAWTATLDFPSNQKGLHSLSYYALSSVSGAETAVEVPIEIQ